MNEKKTKKQLEIEKDLISLAKKHKIKMFWIGCYETLKADFLNDCVDIDLPFFNEKTKQYELHENPIYKTEENENE
jgi:hypothetical protein